MAEENRDVLFPLDVLRVEARTEDLMDVNRGLAIRGKRRAIHRFQTGCSPVFRIRVDEIGMPGFLLLQAGSPGAHFQDFSFAPFFAITNLN